ncbi:MULTISPECIES: hypothetical protein [Pseudomonadota]|uniref:hypothetical protein n=1 Tax=Pseudomonadota TaxID=1224 RepID=UPI0012A7D81D|nr:MULTISPECIES: hypothetical protein [Pseudomonadota]MBP8322283.1 hypothetical protein [Pseudomonas aeruginosa]MDC6162340.1 hypothetical protein [Achromobacter xylosoxidans]CUR68108.1 Invasion protein InvB [Achromobacter xylosoxidans]
MHIDLINLVKEALTHAHCSDRLTEELDPHAPIELHFGSSLMMRVAKTEDDSAVQILARLSDQPGVPGSCSGIDVIEALAEPAPWASHGCISLLDVDGLLHLQAIVAPALVRDGEGFSSALAAFYDRLLVIHQALWK